MEEEVEKPWLLWKGVCREREDPEILRTSRSGGGGLQRDEPRRPDVRSSPRCEARLLGILSLKD